MHRFRTSTRAAGLVLGASFAMTLALPALANSGHQDGWKIDWADPEFQGTADECDALDLEAGDVLWHFVQTKVSGSVAGGSLAATFDEGGPVAVASYKKAGAVLHWAIVTGQDTLLGFASDVTSDGQLNLSHICAAPGQAEPNVDPSDGPGDDAPTDDPGDAPSQEPTSAPSDGPGDDVPTDDPGDAPSQEPTSAPSDGPGDDASTEPGDDSATDDPGDAPTSAPGDDAPTPPGASSSTNAPGDAPGDDAATQPGDDASTAPGQESGGQSPTATPGGNAAGATGTPRVTPPPTDTVGHGDASGSGAGSGWLLAVAGLAALMAALAISAPSRRTHR